METLEMESGPVAAPKRLAGACTMVFVLSILQLLGTVCYVLMVVPLMMLALGMSFDSPFLTVPELRITWFVVLLLLGVLCVVVPFLGVLDSVLGIVVGTLWRRGKTDGLLKQARRVTRIMTLHMAIHACKTVLGSIGVIFLVLTMIVVPNWPLACGAVVAAALVGCKALQCIAAREIYRFTSTHACTQRAEAMNTFKAASLICGLLVGSLLQVATSFLLNGNSTGQMCTGEEHPSYKHKDEEKCWDTHGAVGLVASGLVGLVWVPAIAVMGTVVAVALLVSNSDEQDLKWLKRLWHLPRANFWTIAVCVPVPLLFDILNFWMNGQSLWRPSSFWALYLEPMYTVVLLSGLSWIMRKLHDSVSLKQADATSYLPITSSSEETALLP